MKTSYFYIPIRKLGWIYNELVLDNHRKIRFINEFTNESDRLKELGLTDASRGWYKSCVVLKQETKDGDTGFEYIQEIYKTVAFFRLFLDSEISFEKIYLLEQVTGQKEESFIQKSNLSKKETELLGKWNVFSKAYKKRPSIFNWYSRVQEIDPPREQIVFLCIALEGLLLKSEKQELRYKFSLRGAYLLGKLPEDRIKLMKFFKQVYDYRSAIVHCDEQQILTLITQIGSMSLFRETLDHYTSRLLKLFTDRPKLFDDIDKIVLKGNSK